MIGHEASSAQGAKSIPDGAVIAAEIFMRAPCRVLLLTVPLLTALAASSTAQTLPQPWADAEDYSRRVDITASIGVVAPTDWSDLVLLGSLSPATGVLE